MIAWMKEVALKVERHVWIQGVFRDNCKRLMTNPYMTGSLVWCQNKREMAGILPWDVPLEFFVLRT